MTNKTLLQEADALIYGGRQESYGSVTDNFSRIAAGWDQIFKDKLKPGEHITPQEVGLAMAWLKIARYCHKPKRDNLVDVAGYVGCIDKMGHENEGAIPKQARPAKSWEANIKTGAFDSMRNKPGVVAYNQEPPPVIVKTCREGVLAIYPAANCEMDTDGAASFFTVSDYDEKHCRTKAKEMGIGGSPELAWYNAWQSLSAEERKKYIIQE